MLIQTTYYGRLTPANLFMNDTTLLEDLYSLQEYGVTNKKIINLMRYSTINSCFIKKQIKNSPYPTLFLLFSPNSIQIFYNGYTNAVKLIEFFDIFEFPLVFFLRRI